MRAQLQRPAFRGVALLQMRFLSQGDLLEHREAIARFGRELKPIEAIARTLA